MPSLYYSTIIGVGTENSWPHWSFFKCFISGGVMAKNCFLLKTNSPEIPFGKTSTDQANV